MGREVSRMLRCALEANAPASDKLQASRNLQWLVAQGNGYTGDKASSPRLLVSSCQRSTACLPMPTLPSSSQCLRSHPPHAYAPILYPLPTPTHPSSLLSLTLQPNVYTFRYTFNYAIRLDINLRMVYGMRNA